MEYKNEIKNIINLDNILINKILNIIKDFNKPVIGIHVRLGDYLSYLKLFDIIPVEYYKNALDNYNLSNYKIILFSDDINMAKKKLNKLNLNFIIADDIFQTNEEHFFYYLYVIL